MRENYWFFEKVLPKEKRGSKILIKIKKKIFSTKSPFQKIEILDSEAYGRILVLDGVVQLAKKDEFIYHEMISHLPLFYHPRPENVLIIGGGDGGALREVLKHPIKKVHLVEIDKKVIDVSKKYLPFVCQNAFSDSRLKIFFEDGAKFIKRYKDFYDVVIIDSTDPSNFSFSLFREKFTRNLEKALREKGIVIIQAGGLWSFWKTLKSVFKIYQKIFHSVKIHRANIPSFLEAEWSFLVGGKKIDLEKISLANLKKRIKKIKGKLKYYSPEIHLYSGILPSYLKEKLEK